MKDGPQRWTNNLKDDKIFLQTPKKAVPEIVIKRWKHSRKHGNTSRKK